MAQETFIRFWRSAQAGRPAREAAAWIHRTAVHLAIDRLRRRAVRAAQPARVATFSADEALSNRELLEELARRVPPDALEAGVLHRVDGLTQPEAAHAMGISERTLRRLLVTLDERIARFREEVMT